MTRLLTLNAGSSSLKLAVFGREGSGEAQVLATGSAERIGGSASGAWSVKDAGGNTLAKETTALPDHRTALHALVDCLESHEPVADVAAVAHRVVHGGHFTRPHLIDDRVLAELHRLSPYDPQHLPCELNVIAEARGRWPHAVHAACFDTAFHRTMPRHAQHYALPREWTEAGVIRYGFHGLSYEYITGVLAREAGAEKAPGRVIVAHLGNGASLAAIRDGVSVDTTMGFTPVAGLVMGSRCGDMDPGIVEYVQKTFHVDPIQWTKLTNKASGLLGVSGISADMRELLACEASNERAAEAIAIFCHAGRKQLAAMTASLGGLDTLVFTAGIGEHSAEIRARLCQGMDYLGLALDPEANARHDSHIGAGPVDVRVIPTNEERMLAHHALDILAAATEPATA